MGEECAGKHNQDSGQKAGGGGKTALLHPKEHERANGEDMKRDRPVDRHGQRQDEKNPIRRIKLRTLHSAKVRSTAEDVRIPESKISLR